MPKEVDELARSLPGTSTRLSDGPSRCLAVPGERDRGAAQALEALGRTRPNTSSMWFYMWMARVTHSERLDRPMRVGGTENTHSEHTGTPVSTPNRTRSARLRASARTRRRARTGARGRRPAVRADVVVPYPTPRCLPVAGE